MGVSPFSDEIQRLTLPQIHWVLAMHNHYNQTEDERTKREGLAVAENLSAWQERLTQDTFRETAYGDKKPAWLKVLEEKQQLKDSTRKAT